MYAAYEKIDDKNIPNKKRVVVSRFEIASEIDSNVTTIHRPSPESRQIKESNSTAEYMYNDNEAQRVGEHILFIYFDLQPSSNRDFVGPLRAINDYVQIYTDYATCLDFLNSSNEKIFFISSSGDKQFIKEVHDCRAIEAVFILDSNIKIDKNRFPKLFGVYVHPERLLAALRNAYEWFEQTQMNFFSFEHEKIFLWSQLWKEEFINSPDSSAPSDKRKLVDVAERYYRGNKRILDAVDNFDCDYDRNDALKWCFSAPFPSRFLNHALSTRNPRFIDLCRFLIVDVSYVLKEPTDHKSNYQIFKGIKMTAELLEKLVNHIGKLICPKGFFTCTTSRIAALELARAPDYRPDLKPVLFKLNYDSSVPMGQLLMKDTSTLVVFDVYTAFRVTWITRGPVSIIDLEAADKDGRNMALEYKARYKSANIQKLLSQLLVFPKPPPRLPAIKRSQSSSAKRRPRITLKKVSPPVLTQQEIDAKRMVKRGEVDQAITLYRTSKNNPPRALNDLATLYAEKKGNYYMATQIHLQALRVQEQKGEDPTETLVKLGIVHYNRYDYNQALEYHSRALKLQHDNHEADKILMANNLIGMANAHWGKDNLPEALNHAEEALKINESPEYRNDLNLAVNLTILANIHHKGGNNARAFKFVQRAMAILQRSRSPDSLTLASVLNNLGAIQVALTLYFDAHTSLNRALKICKKILPEGNPKRVTMETNIRRTKEIIKQIEAFENKKRNRLNNAAVL
ncbi:unnamed protein product [Rotaria magnacalcarata]|uniref:Uncharacterized protein n=2 Tax=Rotaria magnacalcarata TaxID=392030 RepID=A0A816R0Z9_9BILA|nr:unnamed protein product [Rotaria magnacalcarata]